MFRAISNKPYLKNGRSPGKRAGKGKNDKGGPRPEPVAFAKASSPGVSLDSEPLLGLVLDELKRVVDYGSSAVVALEGACLKVLACRGPLPQEEIVDRVIRLPRTRLRQIMTGRRKPVIIPDIWADTFQANTFRELVGREVEVALGYTRSWMGIPLIIENQMIGMLALHHDQPHYYQPRHAKRALAFAQQVAVAVENDRLYQQVHHLATVEERERLAREMHDQLSQALGLINVKASLIIDALQKNKVDEANAHLCELKQITTATYADVREDIFSLRSQVETGEKFITVLQEYLADYRPQCKMEIQLTIVDEAAVDLPVETGNQIIRIIQEALSNARKHARAGRVELRFKKEAGQIWIEIVDDGDGFDPDRVSEKNGSFGLHIMRERAEYVGGRLDIETGPGRGVHLIIKLPAQTT